MSQEMGLEVLRTAVLEAADEDRMLLIAVAYELHEKCDFETKCRLAEVLFECMGCSDHGARRLVLSYLLQLFRDHEGDPRLAPFIERAQEEAGLAAFWERDPIALRRVRELLNSSASPLALEMSF